MAIRFSVRPFDPSIEAAYRRLFPGDSGKTPELFSWRFSQNPHGPAQFAVAEEANGIVGLISLVATRLVGGSQTCFGYQAIDTVVHPSMRGRGVFMGLGSVAQDILCHEGEILWGFPNANAAPGWFGRLGWENFGTVPLLMRPLRTGMLFGRLHRSLGVLNTPLLRAGKPMGELCSDPCRMSADLEFLWSSCREQYGTAVDRTGEWLRWRLMDKPGTPYRSVVDYGDAKIPRAFVSTRIAEKHGGKLCYVMEALSMPKDRDCLTRLLRRELALAGQSGAELALAWCPRKAPNYVAYRKAGFLPVPPRLRPIEINFGARILREGCATAAGANWYLSYLDSDTN